jgi:hypothetical protein
MVKKILMALIFDFESIFGLGFGNQLVELTRPAWEEKIVEKFLTSNNR